MPRKRKAEAALESAETRSETLLQIPCPQESGKEFDLGVAVCSYGYLYVPPNKWSPEEKTFRRPLRFGKKSEHACLIAVTQEGSSILVHFEGGTRPSTEGHLASIRDAVVRILHLDEDFSPWYRTCPKWLQQRGLGRTFRSPSLWEDLVKTIFNQNIKFRVAADLEEGEKGFSTYGFNWRFCHRLGTPCGDFPTAREVLEKGIDGIKAAKVGYRADRIYRLAQAVVDESVNLAEIEADAKEINRLVQEKGNSSNKKTKTAKATDIDGSIAEKKADLRATLKGIHGFGDFGVENALQLLGVYDAMPLDSETERLWRTLSERWRKEKLCDGVWSERQQSLYNGWKRDKAHRNTLLKIATECYRQQMPAYAWQLYWFTLWQEVYERLHHGQQHSQHWGGFSLTEQASPPRPKKKRGS